jgi:hypothetical protein
MTQRTNSKQPRKVLTLKTLISGLERINFLQDKKFLKRLLKDIGLTALNIREFLLEIVAWRAK